VGDRETRLRSAQLLVLQLELGLVHAQFVQLRNCVLTFQRVMTFGPQREVALRPQTKIGVEFRWVHRVSHAMYLPVR